MTCNSIYGIPFSQFVVGGEPVSGDIFVGLRNGLDTQFSFNGAAGTGTAIVNTITQTAHGFTFGEIVYFNGLQFALAMADTSADAEVLGIVSAVIDPNTFDLLSIGLVTGLSALIPGAVYFLSDVVAGGLTTTEPSTANHISKPLLIATSNTTGFFFNFRGKIVPAQNLNTLTYVTNTNETAILPNSQPLSTLATGVMYVTTTTGIITSLGSGTVGQALISNGASPPTWQDLITGSWVNQTTTPVSLAANTGYSANTAGLLTFNMPATVPFGTEFEIRGQGAGGWLVQFNGGQTGHLNSTATTAGGTFASTERYDCLSILCTVANTTFVCTSSGVITNA